jgi:CheY-like chemotaxis protein
MMEESNLHGTETILLVEDHSEVRRLCRAVLHNFGYKVLEASHGEDAVRISEQHPGTIHLLVTDVVLPGINGQVVAETIRQRHSSARVLYLSGYGDETLIRYGFLKEENFLPKPFSPVALATKVREILG